MSNFSCSSERSLVGLSDPVRGLLIGPVVFEIVRGRGSTPTQRAVFLARPQRGAREKHRNFNQMHRDVTKGRAMRAMVLSDLPTPTLQLGYNEFLPIVERCWRIQKDTFQQLG